MTISSISDVLKMEPDLPILGVKAKIKSVFAQKKGTKKDGAEWKFQDLVGTDGNSEVKIKVWDSEPIATSAKGKWYYFVSVKGSKGWTGVKSKDDEYNGKVSRIVWVTATAEISTAEEFDHKGQNSSEGGNETASEHSDAALPMPAKESTASRAPATTSQAPKEAKSAAWLEADAVINARRAVGQMANGLILGFAGANYVAATVKERHGITLTSEDLRALAISMHIGLERSGLTHALPSGKMPNGQPAEQTKLTESAKESTPPAGKTETKTEDLGPTQAEEDAINHANFLKILTTKLVKPKPLQLMVAEYLSQSPDGKGRKWLKEGQELKDLTLDDLRNVVNQWEKLWPMIESWMTTDDQISGAEHNEADVPH